MHTRPPCLSSRRAFTLIELLTVIAIIGILAAILIPVVGAVRERARASVCLSNMRQIGLGVQMHQADHGERTPGFTRENNPTSSTTVYAIHGLGGGLVAPPIGFGYDYIDDTEVFFCPGQPNVYRGDGPANDHWSSRWGDPAMGYLWFWQATDNIERNTSEVREENRNNVLFMDLANEGWLDLYNFLEVPHGETVHAYRLGGNISAIPRRIVDDGPSGAGALHLRLDRHYEH